MYHGTGLGLPICKRLVEQMKGTLTLKSLLGKGSCFTVTLPDLKYGGAAPLKETSAPLECKSDMKGSVLLVDDVAVNLKVLDAMARKLGLETHTAASGREALESLAVTVPDLIFTDMWMPGMNGAEFAREVKSHKAYSRIPVIAVTADTEVQELNRNSDFYDILLKPITIEKLRKIVEKLMSVNKKSASNAESTK